MPVNDRSEAPLVLRFLGPPEVRLHGDPMPALRHRKGFWTLALLVLRQGRSVDRAWLSGLLWPETGQSQAYYNLRRVLTDLRRALGEEAGRLRSPIPSLLSLDLTGSDVDVIEFDESIRRGDRASLERAVGLYRGPLLEGCTEEWALPERDAREQAYLGALETLAEGNLARGEPAKAVEFLRRVTAGDPFRESAARKLMEALAGEGDFAEIVTVFRRLREELRWEMNTEPSAETREVFRRLRLEGRRRMDPPTVTSTSGLGVGKPVSRLPRPLTALIGREREIEAIDRCLESSRLVTLVGVGGIGKTRLALRVAEDRVELHPDGVWFVDLTTVPNPDLIPHAVMTALGILESPGQSPRESLAAGIGRKQMLLVLDNCEHLAGACARLIAHLLENVPKLRVLATSRQSLGLTGEIVREISPLSLPEPLGSPSPGGIDLRRLSESEAVRLFVERARAIAPEFALDEGNARSVIAICRRVDGISLAIEMAAARVRTLTPAQIESRLDTPLRLLVNRSRKASSEEDAIRNADGDTAPESGASARYGAPASARHDTLRATMDWSCRLLNEFERGLLLRLSVFTGGFTLELAERIAVPPGCEGSGRSPEERDSAAGPSMPDLPAGDVLEGIESLIDKSLVRREESGEREHRFRLFEIVRQHAAEMLCPGERLGLHERHASIFADFAVEAEPELDGPRMVEWLDRLDREQGNLRAALDGCVRGETGMEIGLRTAAALCGYWWIRGRLTEGRVTLERLLARSEGLGEAISRAAALAAAAQIAHWQWDYRAAEAFAAESLGIARRRNEPAIAARSLMALAFVAWNAGDLSGAEERARESLEIWRQLDCRGSVARTLFDLGLLAEAREESARARAFYEESLALQRELGNRRGIAVGLNGLAENCRYRGETEKARRYYREALEIRRELDDRLAIASTLHSMGLGAIDEKHTSEAKGYFGESLRILRDLGNVPMVLLLLAEFARIAVRDGRTERAVRLFGAMEAQRKSAPIPVPVAGDSRDRAHLEKLRESMGGDAFETAYETGRLMTWEETLETALADEPEAR